MYLDEAPIPKDIDKILRFLRLPKKHRTDVEQVLNDFLTEVEQGWFQDRVLFEINEYRVRREAASRAGKASGKARKLKAKERTLNGRTTDPEPTNNHKPITNSKKNRRFTPPTFVDVHTYCHERDNNVTPQHFLDHYTANGWKVGKNPMKDWKAAVRTWEKNNAETRPGNNSQAAGRKPTPAERVREKRAAAQQRDMGTVGTDDGDIRTPVGIAARGRTE